MLCKNVSDNTKYIISEPGDNINNNNNNNNISYYDYIYNNEDYINL